MVVDPPGALRFVQHRAHALGTQRTNDLLVAVGKFFQCEVDLALQDNVLLQLQTGTFRQLQQAQQARFLPVIPLQTRPARIHGGARVPQGGNARPDGSVLLVQHVQCGGHCTFPEITAHVLHGHVQLPQGADDVQVTDIVDAVQAVTRLAAMGMQQALFLIITQRVRAKAVQPRHLGDLVIFLHPIPPGGVKGFVKSIPSMGGEYKRKRCLTLGRYEGL